MNPPELLLCPQVEHINTLDLSNINSAEGRAAGAAVAGTAMSDLLALRDWRAGVARSVGARTGLGQQQRQLLPVG
jgi:hypothetical protein